MKNNITNNITKSLVIKIISLTLYHKTSKTNVMNSFNLELNKSLFICESDRICESLIYCEYDDNLSGLGLKTVTRKIDFICQLCDLTEITAIKLIDYMNFGTLDFPDFGYYNYLYDNYTCKNSVDSFLSALHKEEIEQSIKLNMHKTLIYEIKY